MKVWRTELTPVDFLRRAAYVYGPKVGLVHADGRRYTWAEIGERSWRLANALRALGLEKGDRLALWSPNRFEWVVLQYATARVGAITIADLDASRISAVER